MTAWFISDLHLKSMKECNSQTLLRFLHFLKTQDETTHLILLGDVFDFWIGPGQVFQVEFSPLIQALKDLKNKGVQILYCEGNHDVHIHAFWRDQLGFEVFIEPRKIQLGPWLVRMEHGDYINPNDTAYLRWRATLRSLPLKVLAHALPSSIVAKIGKALSERSRKETLVRREIHEEEYRQMIRRYAQSEAEQDQFEYLITGHMHITDEYTFEKGGQRISINLGSWFTSPQALKIDDKGHQWVSLENL
jgi:UDP-2,3-diacylglucosamine hydrolase